MRRFLARAAILPLLVVFAAFGPSSEFRADADAPNVSTLAYSQSPRRHSEMTNASCL